MASILNYETVREVSLAGWLLSYISIPTFSYTGIIWKGASEIVTQFNFAASKNFTIRRLPVAPTNVDYCAVIRWRSGTTVYRYKLWQTVGETLNEKLYNGEKIGANFVIEIWNTQTNTTVTNIEAITFETSIRMAPTSSYISLDPYEEVVGVEQSSQFYTPDDTVVTTLPTTGLIAHYDNGASIVNNGSTVLAWLDNIGGRDFAPGGSSVPVALNTKGSYSGVLLFDGNMTAVNAGSALADIVIFAAIKQRSWAVDENIINVQNPGAANLAGIKQAGTSPGIKAFNQTSLSAENVNLPIGYFDVLRLYISDVGNSTTFDISGQGSVAISQAGFSMGTQIQLGESDTEFLEILIFNNALMTGALIEQAYNYLYGKYDIGFTLPGSNDSDLSGGNNT